MHVSNSSSNSNNNNNPSKVYLTCEQIDKLKHVLDRPIPICSSPPSSFPTLNITPRYFLREVLRKLKNYSIDITSIRLNGGAASYVLVNEPNFVYRDIDILIDVKTPLSSEQKTTLFSSNNEPYLCDVWTIIKYVICSCLLEHITNTTSTEQQYTHHYLSTVLDTYAKKNIKISSEQDSWALLSLQNYSGQNLELKFVEHLKRQWQFSVDSFQINLEPLLYDKPVNNHLNRHLYKCPSISSITKRIKTKSLIIDAINGLTIIKKEYDHDEQVNETKNTNEVNPHQSHNLVSNASPLQFGFFTPSSSPDTINHDNNIECQTLATITTIATSTTTNNNHPVHESRSRLSKASVSTLNDESSDSSLQFHLSLYDDIDDGIVSDADDSVNEDDDQVFRTPVNTNSAPSSPATIIATDTPPSPPVIEVHSVYKDLPQALDHLNKKLIATYAPETMRGGGLLKYCDLLAQNYTVHDVTDMVRMQRYMCSRFFIDYKSVPEQMHVITQYVATHFLPLSMTNSEQSAASAVQCWNTQPNSKSTHEQNNVTNARLCLLFFDHLSIVIQQSTVCLTHHDKAATLMNINQLKQYYHYKYEYLFIGDNYHQQRYHSYHNHNHNYHNHHHCSSSSSNSSRSSSPSSSSSNSYRYFRHNNPNSNSHRHPNAHRYHNNLRQSTTPLSYHSGSRNYSNHFHSNHQVLPNHHPRRHAL